MDFWGVLKYCLVYSVPLLSTFYSDIRQSHILIIVVESLSCNFLNFFFQKNVEDVCFVSTRLASKIFKFRIPIVPKWHGSQKPFWKLHKTERKHKTVFKTFFILTILGQILMSHKKIFHFKTILTRYLFVQLFWSENSFKKLFLFIYQDISNCLL